MRMRRLLIAVALLLSAAAAHAQAPSAFPYSKPMQNDPTTGTTQWTLTKQNASGNAVIMTTTDVNGYAGVCVANCGKVGTAWVAFAGLVPVTVDGTATINHYLLISTTTGGDGHDNGATSYPYTVVVGRVNAGATTGNQAMVDLFPPEIRPASGPVVFGTGAGIAQAQTLTTTIGPVATALTTGWTYCWVPSNANSGAAPTLAPDGLTATTITKTPNHTALVANDLLTSRVACVIYDGANMELQNPQTAASGGSTTNAQFSTTDTLTASTINTTETVFATTYKIPASTLAANKLLRISAVFSATTSATPVSAVLRMKVCTISGCGSGTVTTLYQADNGTPDNNDTNKGFGGVFLLQGTAAVGASVNTVTGIVSYGNITGNSFLGRNNTAQPVAFATNADEFVTFTITYSGNTAGNSVTLQQLFAEQY